MRLKNLRLSLANVARTTNAKTMSVNEVGEIHATDKETGKPLDEITGYTITCSAYRGDELKVKFPPTVKQKWEQLKAELENDVTIDISFDNLKLTAYAMKSDSGNILSGVSAKADDFTIESSTAEELEIDL